MREGTSRTSIFVERASSGRFVRNKAAASPTTTLWGAGRGRPRDRLEIIVRVLSLSGIQCSRPRSAWQLTTVEQRRGAMGDRTENAGDGRVLYLYGVVAGDRETPRSDVARLRAISSSGLGALVEEVPASDFGRRGARAEAARTSSGWRRSRAGTSTCWRTSSSSGAVIPAPLCTLFSSGEAVRDSADRERRAATSAACLASRAGASGASRSTAALASLPGALAGVDDKLRALEGALGQAGPGQAFVLRKQRERPDRSSSPRSAIDERGRRGPARGRSGGGGHPLPPAAAPAGRRWRGDDGPQRRFSGGRRRRLASSSRSAPSSPLAWTPVAFAIELTGPWPAVQLLRRGGHGGARRATASPRRCE